MQKDDNVTGRLRKNKIIQKKQTKYKTIIRIYIAIFMLNMTIKICYIGFSRSAQQNVRIKKGGL